MTCWFRSDELFIVLFSRDVKTIGKYINNVLKEK